MVIENIHVAVEEIGPELVGAKWDFCFFCPFCLLALPFHIVGEGVRIRHVLEGFKVIRNDS